MMRISAIVAMSSNRVIGREGRLPWRLSEDLKRFKELTWGHPVIMGRKTFESIGKVLPGRENLVISRQKSLAIEGVRVFGSLSSALNACRNQFHEVFIIGGSEIYDMAMPQVDRLYLTLIHQEFEGDVVFSALDWNEFTEVAREDRTDPLPFSFLILDRKRSS
jgi:dihydrofolate reductase